MHLIFAVVLGRPPDVGLMNLMNTDAIVVHNGDAIRCGNPVEPYVPI